MDLTLLVIVVIVALISFRMARALSMDEIGKPVRSRLENWAHGKPDSKVRAWFCELVHCPHCTGVWISFVVSMVVTAQMLDVDFFVDLVIAGAAMGAQSLMATYAQEDKIEMDFTDEALDAIADEAGSSSSQG